MGESSKFPKSLNFWIQIFKLMQDAYKMSNYMFKWLIVFR